MVHNHIKVEIAGIEEDHFDVRFGDFITKMQALKRALMETDRLVSKGRSVYYRIVDMTHNSPATVELEIVPTESTRNYSDQIAETFYTGLRMIQENHQAPEIFDGQALRAYRELAPVQDGKITNLRIYRNGDSISVFSTFAASIDVILGPDEYENGSISGLLEQINVHASQNVFMIYSTADGQKLKCVFPGYLRKIAVDAVDRHITVYGRMKYKMRDTYPYEMSVNDIEVHDPTDQLPTLGSLKGIAPNATGGMKSEDFIRRVRNEWSES